MKLITALKLIGILLLVVFTLLAMGIAKDLVDTTQAEWESENVCIQGWVNMGMERKHIYRDNGDCYYARSFNPVKSN